MRRDGAGPERGARPSWRAALPWGWSLLLALLLLGPALGPGYVLSYDMVWVPDLALRSDFWGLGSGLPRAVPSDAVVAVLDEVLGGAVLQKVVLLGCLVLGGAGAARLTDRSSLVAPLAAAGFYVWNPFVAERLLIGHWPVLVGYAALPWLVGHARSWRTSGRVPAALWWVLPLGSLSASAGLVSALVVVAFAASRSPRRWLALAGLVAAANAPWLVAGALHAGSAFTDPLGARVFALADEGSVPGPLAALGLGGIWNSEVVPGSRTGVLAWVSLVLLLLLVGVGLRRWREAAGGRDVAAYAVCWGVGWGLAVLTWASPGVTGWVGEHLPGGGLVRDGARLLALCAPLLAAVVGHGAARVSGALPRAARPTAVLALLLLPVAVLPDVALGWSGRLTADLLPRRLRGRARGRAGPDRRGRHGRRPPAAAEQLPPAGLERRPQGPGPGRAVPHPRLRRRRRPVRVGAPGGRGGRPGACRGRCPRGRRRAGPGAGAGRPRGGVRGHREGRGPGLGRRAGRRRHAGPRRARPARTTARGGARDGRPRPRGRSPWPPAGPRSVGCSWSAWSSSRHAWRARRRPRRG